MLNFRRTLYPPAYQQIRQMRQENSMDEQGLLARLRGKIKKIKKRKSISTGSTEGGLGRIQGCHPDMQRWDWENQGEDGTKFGEGCEK